MTDDGGGAKKRVRREAAARTAPIRDATMMFRRAGPAVSGPVPSRSDAAAVPDPPRADGARRAVDVAYRVLDEHLRRGRAAAETKAPGAERGDFAPKDAQDLLRRAVRYWADMLVMWVDFIGPQVPLEAILQKVEGALGEAGAAGSPASPGSSGGAPVTVEVASPRPVQVSVDLPPGAAASNLGVQPLTALGDAGTRAIDVTLSGGGAERLVVSISIGAEQPAGTYAGVVFDRALAEPRGTVRVVVR